ncbi:peptidase inhibitor family I36 protein [Streptomyces sp. NPDC090080]|uniref:peptidase inhibitor family I36 protein n=1 Tax=Streptomyces sp. NPDC090080 TaxID=3365939 RepID=UPI0037F81B69
MRRSIMGVIGVLGAATVALVASLSVGAPEADAAAACPANAVCFYESADFHGSMYQLPASGHASDFLKARFYNGTGVNDRVSSIINNTNYKVHIYKDVHYANQLGYGLKAHGNIPNLDWVYYNDMISSASL